MLSLFKEKKLVFYLDPKPNAYIKKIATPCQSAEKITFSNFFKSIFPNHSKTQPSLSSLGSAGYLNSFHFQKCKQSSFNNYLHLSYNTHNSLLTYKDDDTFNAEFPFFLTFKSKQDLSFPFQNIPITKTKEDNSYNLGKQTKKPIKKEFLL